MRIAFEYKIYGMHTLSDKEVEDLKLKYNGSLVDFFNSELSAIDLMDEGECIKVEEI